MTYKIVEKTMYGNMPLCEDGVFSLGGKVKQFNTKAEASAFIIKFLPWTVGDYVVKEVDQ